MKSSSGQYFQSLDHVRAIGVFTVFVWHFLHFEDGLLASPLAFPLSFFTEGHTGVAIFMTLSGYLFAKLSEDKTLKYFPMLWNRFLRLAPLFVVQVGLIAIELFYNGKLSWIFVEKVFSVLLFPVAKNGWWAITVELHFYLILPLLLFFNRWSRIALLLILFIPILARTVIHYNTGEVETIAYFTLIGRLDQFIFGILAFQNRHLIANRSFLAFSFGMVLLVFLYFFDRNGGFYGYYMTYPSPTPIWILLTTFEGVTYGALIAWYDNSFRHTGGRLSGFIALVGTYSYSIYLLHFFVVHKIPVAIDQHLFELSNQYLVIAMAIPSFLIMIPVAYVSYRFIEQPCLRYRMKYLH